MAAKDGVRGFLRSAVAALALCCSAHAVVQGILVNVKSPRDGVKRPPVIDGQDIRFAPFSVEGEIVSKSKYSGIAQDNNGFLWFGTAAGLYRYDGYTLKPLPSRSRGPE